MAYKKMAEYHIFPFGKVKPNSRIIIYGMGDVGHQYIEQVLTTQYCNVLFAVDQNYQNIKKSLLRICAISEIKYVDFDYIVIANASFDTAKLVKERLIECNVDDDKIIYEDKMCSVENSNEEKMLQDIQRKTEWNWGIVTQIQSKTSKIDAISRVMLSIDSWTRSNSIDESKYYDYYLELRRLLTIRKLKEKEMQLCRIGKKYDGGYIMLEDFIETKIAYSFGISDDVSWDLDMVKRGLDIYMYDHTIQQLPLQNNHFHFYRKGISSSYDDNDNNLDTLDNLIKVNGHEHDNNMILKMDVEGAEWGFLQMVSKKSLNQYRQITFEFHHLTNLDYADKIVKSLQKLNETHQLVHIHANNYAKVAYAKDLLMPDVLEATYIRKDNNEFILSENVLPIEIDCPCWPERTEIELGYWNKPIS